MTFSKIEDKLYPDISMSKNREKKLFRRVSRSLGNWALIPRILAQAFVFAFQVGVTYVDIAEWFLDLFQFYL